MNRIWMAACALVVAAGTCPAADPATDAKTGLKVGEKAPDFELKDQGGEKHSLSTMLKGGPVALVFYRSAGW